MGNMISRDSSSARDCTLFVPGRSIGPSHARQVAVVLGIACVFLFFGRTTALAQRTTAVGEQTVIVNMTNSLRFDPQELVIHAGDTVLWTNTSTIVPHTATAEETANHLKGFNSGSFHWNW